MRKLIYLFIFQSFVCFGFSQSKPNISDSITKVIQGLPEYKAVLKNADSLQLASHSVDGKYNAGILLSIVYKNNGEVADKIVDAAITEQFDTVTKTIYAIKYDIGLKKIISIKKE